MIHHALIKQCNRVFTCKEKRDHHTLAQSYLGIFRSWQRNKNYNTELHINKKAQILFTMLVLGIKWIPIAKKSWHAERLPLRGRSSIMLHVMERKRKTEDKKAALLRKTLL